MIKMVPLGEVAYVIMGSAPPGESYNEPGKGIPMIAGAGDYGENYPVPKKWTTAPSRVTEVGDLIVCVRATIGDLNWADKKYCLGRGVAGIRPKTGTLDIRYAAHYINTKQEDLSKLGTGSTFLAIRRADLEDFPIPLPPLAEQKRIASILDKADAIRRKRKRAMQLADEFLRSVFFDMFGDPVKNPKGWPEVKLDKISNIVSGVTKGRHFNGKKTAFVPYMRVANVQDGNILLDDIQEIEALETEVEKYRLKKGDVLLTEGGDPDKLGRGSVWKGEIDLCIHQNHIFRVRPDIKKILPEYLSALLGSPRGKRYFLKAAKQTTGVATINKTQLSDFPVLVPNLTIQNVYLKMIERHGNLSKKHQKMYEDSDILFMSLTQRAFRGEL